MLKILLRLVGMTLYGIVFLEAFISLASPQVIEPRYTTAAPWGVRQNIPGARYVHQTPRKPITFHINSQGMRDDREFAPAKPPGVCRIEVFGDSFFMGYEVDLEESFARRLENRLRSRRFNAEVLNFSVSGFGQAEMLATYRAQGRRFTPDVVISSWHYTDLDDNLRSRLFKLQGGQLVAANRTYTPSVKTQDRLARIAPYVWVSEHSQLWAYVRERLGFQVRTLLASLRKAKTAEGASDADQRRLSAALLREFQSEAAADGAKFLAVDVPRRSSGDVLDSAKPLLEAQVWRDVPLVSPFEQFEMMKARDGARLYFDRGGAMHMTPPANDVLAGMVERWLADEGWLDACRKP